jgi:serine protease AprX
MKRTHSLLQIIIAFFITLSLIGPAALSAEAPGAKAHPLLIQIAEQHPQKQVGVIIQKLAEDNRLEAKVKQVGGVITHDLDIINAFAARLAADKALELSMDPDVRWVSLDAPVEQSGKPAPTPPPPVTTNTYLGTLGVQQVWNMGWNGSGIGVAVIDSGISPNQDTPVSRSMSFNPNATSVNDFYGHGTHVAGIIAGDGDLSGGLFKGIAPGVNLISLRVSDDTGMASEADVVAAIQWVYNNKAAFNIRVVNISLNSTVEQSYHTSPLAAAVEILWFNGVVVVVSSGNANDNWNYANTAPANDPFVITVGAADEKATTNYSDDSIATYTAWTITADGHLKPEIFAPGSNIISVLSPHSDWDVIAPDRVLYSSYFRLSGTSMAAPMVTGAVALLLQDEPSLTPDQVKYRLLNATTRQLSIYVKAIRTTYYFPYLDVYATVTGTTTASSNTGLTASQLLWSGSEPITWSSVAWNSVAWNSVAWNSVAWNSVAWNSVAWNSAYWGP